MTQALKEQTGALYREYHKSVPAEIMKVIDAATSDLINSNIGNTCLQVGSKVPDFNLPDAYGKIFNLYSALKKGPVVLSFYRGGWCTFCNLELKALQDNLTNIRNAGAELIAVTPQNPDGTKNTLEELGIDYAILTDQSNSVAGEFGLTFEVPDALKEIYENNFGLNIPKENLDESYKLPITATYVVNTDGYIVSANTDPNFVNRLEPADILETLNSLGR